MMMVDLVVPADRVTRGRRADLIALLLVGAGFSGFWGWAVMPDPSPGDNIQYAAHEYFPLMVEGWLQGRLDLPLPVPEGLLVLPDPYDPTANKPFRYAGEAGIHDLSLYGGRLYMYWGPTPALVAFLPWRLLTGHGLDTAWAAWALTLAGWLFASMLLLLVVRRFYPRTGPTVRISALLVVGVANFATVVLHRPSVYEVSIAAAYTFSSLAWWQLAVALWRPPALRAVPLAIASLAVGLAVAARPIWIVVSPVLLVALWDIRSTWRRPLFRLLAGCAVIPAMACVLLLLLLNDLRFDSPFEFGTRYQLGGQPPLSELFSLRHLPSSVAMYLLAPPATTDYFPFLFPSAWTNSLSGRGSENVFGLFPLLPILCVVALSPLALRVCGLRKLVVVLATGFFSVLTTLSMFLFGVVLRYAWDLAPTLALLAVIGLLLGEDRWRRATVYRRAFRGVWIGLLVLSFVSTFLATCAMSPRRSAPLLSRITLLANTLALHVGWSPASFIERLELELMLPADIPPEREEVLISTGRAPFTNVVYLRRSSPTHVVVGYHRGDALRAESVPMTVDAAVPHTLLVEFGSLYPPVEHPYWSSFNASEAEKMRTRVRVQLDDKVLLDGHAGQWRSLSAKPVFGDLPGGSGGAHRFTGAFLGGVRHDLPLSHVDAGLPVDGPVSRRLGADAFR
ncbi:MAG: hypothetical protein VYD18_01335 [Candidatus Latescibacterota bacterium]|nr:hypothetical protein [Candidatus Latescibacterota bacterium]